jgi:glycosyltransferase involved in cell wall biosynthesis
MVLSRDRSGTLDQLLDIDNVELHYTNAKSELLGAWKLIRLLARHPFSLVFSSSTHLNALTSLLRRMRILRAERVVARESTLIFERSFGWRGAIIKSLYFFYGGHDMLVCQTDRMRRSLESNAGGWLKPRPVTIPNPVDMARAKFHRRDRPRDGLQIAWCGRLSAVKSPEIALHVLASIRDQSAAPVKMFLIGDGPERRNLEALSVTLGLSDSLVFVGHAQNPCEIMSQCDMGLMTSKVEGFPNVVLEMLASGIRRVVSTNCAGGMRDIPGVEVLDSGAPEAFARAILRPQAAPAEEVVRDFLEARSPERYFQLIAGMASGD